LPNPAGVALDKSGNLYVAEFNGGTGGLVVEYPWDGGTTWGTPVTFVNWIGGPFGLAFDAANDLFIADYSGQQVVEVPSGCTLESCQVLVENVGFYGGHPKAVAVDSSGDVFVDNNTGDAPSIFVAEVPVTAYGCTRTTCLVGVGYGLSSPDGVTLDASGDIYIGDFNNGRVLEVRQSSFNLGTVSVGTTSAAVTAYFDFGAASTLNATPYQVVTQGQSGLDFADAGGEGGSGCAAASYVAGNTCIVNLDLTPKSAGLVDGALTLTDNTNTIIATLYLSGTGSGPEVTFFPNPLTFGARGGGLIWGRGLTVDRKGNIFVADSSNNSADEYVAASSYSQSILSTSFSGPTDVALDGAGNVFVADTGDNAVKELVAPAYTTTNTIGSGFNGPSGVAIDGAGNVFVADTGNHAIKEIVAPAYTVVKTLNTASFTAPSAIAIDTSGNLFVADSSLGTVSELTAASGYVTVTSPITGLAQPSAVAVDASGNVYVADTGHTAVDEFLAADSYAKFTLTSTFANSSGLALDANGNVYVTASGHPQVGELELSAAPTLNFGTVSAGTTTSPQAVTVSNIGNSNLTFPVAAAFDATTQSNGSFRLDASSTCTTSPLNMGTSCTDAIDFAPPEALSYSGTFTLTDNNLNTPSPYATQAIDLGGTGETITFVTTSLSSGTVGVALTPQTLQVSGGSGSYTFALTGGALPAGLGLSSAGTISGTPTAAGTVTGIQVTVTDTSTNVTGTKTYSMTIAQATPVLSVTNSPVAYNGSPQSATLTATASGIGTVTGTFSSVQYNGSGTVPTAAGTYAITATFTPNDTTDYATVTGASAGNFVISQLTPVLMVTNSPVTYNGSPQSATVTAGVVTGTASNIQYNASPTVPTNVGTYAITADFSSTNSNYTNLTGASAGNFVINPASFIVTVSTDDSGTASNCTPQTTPGHGTDASCSLRDALLEAAAAGGGNISFDATAFATAKTITLANGALGIPSATTIAGATTGSGATLVNLVTVDGNGASEVFTVSSGVTGASIANLTIQHGNNSGIQNAGALTLTADSITSNTNSGSGGGIVNGGGLTLTGSTISGNTPGGAGGGIANNGTLTLTGTTISGNTASSGAGIFNNSAATLVMSDSTVSGNSATNAYDGGGIISIGSGTVALANSILSGNTSNGASDDLDGGAYSDNGGNIIGVKNGGTVNGTPIDLAPLANYGGPTQTLIPLPGSPAICAGSSGLIPAGITTDQRGYPNTNTSYGFTPSPCVDAGAVQTNYALNFTTQPTDTPVATNFAAAVTFTESGNPFQPVVTIPLTLTGNGTLTGGSATTSAGVASYTLQVDTAGSSDTLTANLTLNSALVPAVAISAVSNTFAVGVTTPPIDLDYSTNDSITYGTPETFYAYLPSYSATGTVTFYNNGTTVLGSGPVSGGMATFSSSTLATGSYSITAYYSGDANYNPTTSSSLPLTVYPIPSTMASPSPGSSLTSASTTFTWNAASGSVTYGLNVGTSPGASDLVNIAPLSGTSVTVTLPTNGAMIYVRLWTVFNGTGYFYNDYTYTEFTQSASAITSPTPGTTLTSASTTFTWNAGSGSVTGYGLNVGTTLGGADLVNIGPLSGTSVTVNLPTNGTTIYVRLWTEFSGNIYLYKDYTYTEFTQSASAITSPSPGGTLTSASTTFTWNAASGGSVSYGLNVGTTGVGSADLVNIYPLSGTSTTVNLPTNGTLIYVRLWTVLNGTTFLSRDYTYTEFAQSAAVITIPTNTSTLTAASTTFTWSAGPAGTTSYGLNVGTTGVGSADLVNIGPLSGTSATVTLPTNGAMIYVRLWTVLNGTTYLYHDYTYTEFTQSAAVITIPTNTSTLTSASTTFTWSAGPAGTTGYGLNVGTTGVGSADLVNIGPLSGTSTTVTLPTNGTPIYVRLWTILNGTTYLHNDYTYTEFTQ
jgi:hypothetical protein